MPAAGFVFQFLTNLPVLGCGRDARATWRGHPARRLKLVPPLKLVPSLPALTSSGEWLITNPLMMVDLNVDIAEGGACDDALLALASSANIACGGHAGGGAMMREALEQTARAGVAIGAHPGYRDRGNFGRLETGETVDAITCEIRRQLLDFCEACCATPHHVKPHGALYHRADRDDDVAQAICGVIREIVPEAWLYAFAGGGLFVAAKDAGLKVCGEGFIDRGYAADGRLIPRGDSGAVIESPEAAAAQALRLAGNQHIRTLCVHGDGPHAVAVLRAASNALAGAGWHIGPPDFSPFV